MKLKQKPKWEHFKFQLIYKLLDIITLTKKFCEESLKSGDRNSFNKMEALGKVDKLVKMNVRLKNEIGVDSTSYWKRTHGAMKKISERLVKLANKVGQLY